MIDGAVLNFVDISAARQAEDRLHDGEVNLRTVAESTHDYAIITLDLAGLVTSWNNGAQRMFGYAEQEMLGRPIATIFTPQGPRRRCARRRNAPRARKVEETTRLTCSGR